ncbi:MAG: Flp pilus assembly protein CpaB [Acidobacteriota bacterium]
MNRNRMIILALFAILMSVVVAFLAYRMLQNRFDPSQDTIQIIVALEKIPVGTRLTEQQLRLTTWPANASPEGSFKDPQQLIGRGVIVPLTANEPILETKLAPKEAGAGLTTVIPEGMRAVSVKVDDVTGVAGFVTPGTHVDVIAVGSVEGRDGDLSKVFLENIEVLAAGQNVERDAQGKPLNNVQVVTLLVTPADAQKLVLASVESRIRLALRNPLDTEQANPIASSKTGIYTGSSTTSSPSSSPAAAPTTEPAPVKYKPVVVRVAPRKPVAPKPVVTIPPPTTAATPPPQPTKITVEVELIKGDKRETRIFEKQPPNN